VISFFLAIVAVLELARALPLIPAFRDLSACGQHAMRLMARRGVSEWGKERAMRILSARMFVRSIRAGGLLLATASPLLVVLAFAANWPQLIGMRADDWTSRLWLVPFTLGYAALRWQVRRVQRR
jgi:hypothetical protein